MEIKTNFYIESLKEYQELRKENNNEKPELLFHICCGACSCYPLVFLHDLFKVTIFFSNSNIYPRNEYDKRLDTLKKYVEILNEKLGDDMKIIEDNYDYESFRTNLLPYKDQPENSDRCHICITKRLERLFDYASKHDYHLVSTVMSISRNKDSDFLNKTGLMLQKAYPGIRYFVNDFKKGGGQDKGIKISKQFDIYRQDYCGCEFSIYYDE